MSVAVEDERLVEIIRHFDKSGWIPGTQGDGWAMPDDGSSLCFEDDLPDGTKFWLDIESRGVTIVWRKPDAKTQIVHLVARQEKAAVASEWLRWWDYAWNFFEKIGWFIVGVGVERAGWNSGQMDHVFGVPEGAFILGSALVVMSWICQRSK